MRSTRPYRLARANQQLFTKTDLATGLGHRSASVVYRWITAGFLPPPDVPFGRRMYYSKAVFNRLVKKFGRGQ